MDSAKEIEYIRCFMANKAPIDGETANALERAIAALREKEQRCVGMSKLHIRIILKNGAEFTVECDEFELAKDGFGNLKSYRIEGITKNKPIYIDFTQVAAILNVMSSETGGAE